ncbi:MAG: dicarboxylate/amino acid:cation symporter [Parachlamydiales bacterium]
MKLWVKIIIGVVLGLVVGWVIGPKAAYLKPIGTIFLSLINMLVVLLVFASMTVGITSIHDPKKLTRIGLKTLGIYLVTTVIAIWIGLLLANIVRPGVGAQLGQVVEPSIAAAKGMTLKDLFLGIIPSNPIAAFTDNTKILQVIVFSVFLGIALNLCGEKGRPLLRILESLAEAMYRLTSIVMEAAPYGVFGIMAWVAGTFGWKTLLSLVTFLLTNWTACAIQVFVVDVGILWLLSRVNPWHFFKGMGDAIAFAMSTNSSTATVPVTLHCVQENLGVSKNISSFVIPLGSTINMNGTAIYQAIAAVFIAQAYGITLGWEAYLTITVTAVLCAVGAAGIPGTGFVMLVVVLGAVGLPIEGIAILFGIDRLREMVSTAVNIIGDGIAAVWVARGEGELDIDQYNRAEVVGYEGSEV